MSQPEIRAATTAELVARRAQLFQYCQNPSVWDTAYEQEITRIERELLARAFPF